MSSLMFADLLPNEIWTLILEYLTSDYKTLREVQLTSSRFRSLVRQKFNVIKTFKMCLHFHGSDFTGFYSLKYDRDFLLHRQIEMCFNLNYHSRLSLFLSSVDLLFPNIQQVQVTLHHHLHAIERAEREANVRKVEEILKSIGQKFSPKINRFIVENAWSSFDMELMPVLQELIGQQTNLQEIKFLYKIRLPDLGSNWLSFIPSTLRRLKLDDVSSDHIKSIARITNNQLQELVTNIYHSINSLNDFETLLKCISIHLSNLTSLTICGGYLSHSIFRNLNPNLKALGIYLCEYISDTDESLTSALSR